MEAAAAFKPPRLRIGALLLRSGLLSAEQLAEALEEKEATGQRIGEIVVQRGWLSDDDLARTLAEQFRLDFADLDAHAPEASAARLLAPQLAAALRAVPVKLLPDGTLLVAVADPTIEALGELPEALGLEVRVAVAPASAIDRALGGSRAARARAVEGADAPPEPDPEPEARPEPEADAEPAAESLPDSAPVAHLSHRPLLGSLFVRDGALSPQQLAEALIEKEETEERLGEILLRRGWVTEEALARALGEQLELQYVDLAAAPPEDRASRLLSPALARYFRAVPLRFEDESTVLVAVGDPMAFGVDDLERALGLGVRLAVATESALEEAIARLEAEEDALRFAPRRAPEPLELPRLRLVGDPPEPAQVPPPAEAAQEPVAGAGPEHVPAEKAAPPASEPTQEESGAAGAATTTPPAGVLDAGPGPTSREGEMTDELHTHHEGVAEPLDADPEPAAGALPAEQEWGASAEAPAAAGRLAAPEDGGARDPAGPDEPAGTDDPGVPAGDALAFWGGAGPDETVSIDLDAASEGDGAAGGDLVPYFEHRRPQLGTLLLRRGLITPDQLAEALEEKEATGARLGDIALSRGWISEQDLARSLAEQHRLEFIDVAAMPPNSAVAALLPEKYARRYGALPVRYLDNETLLVAVADPTNVLAGDELRLVLGPRIRLAVAPASDIEALIDRLYPETGEAEQPLVVAAGDDGEEGAPERDGPFEVLDQHGHAPAVEFVNEVIRRAIQEGASDIHFEPRAERLLVRARIDGVMRDLRIGPARLTQAVTARLKVMGELDIAERRTPQDGRVTIRFGGKPVDLRVAAVPTTYGEQIVLRILYRTATPLGFEELGVAPDTMEQLVHAISQPYGAVVSVGPTGSGKTTTLYAALGMLNTKERCLMTIEDPVEYQLEGVNQIQVNPRAGLTFAQGLRTILRSDPDVLLVGEIRDPETAKIAVQAAMTGHLVLSTLHADNVGSAVSRLTDMDVERQLLATTINCLFAQRLARRLCPSCREPYEADVEELLGAGAREADLPVGGAVTLYRARGCSQCVGGYKGRIGLFEVLLVDPRMRRLIETATAEEIYEAAVAGGMRTLQQDGLRLCASGHTSLEEARRVAGVPRI